MELPSKNQILEEVDSGIPEDIEPRSAHKYREMAYPLLGVQLRDGNYSPSGLRDAARIAGVFGLGILRADDLVDGDDGFEPREPEELLENYRQAYTGGEIPEGTPAEKGVYRTAKILGDYLREDADRIFKTIEVDGEERTVEETLGSYHEVLQALDDLKDLYLRAEETKDYQTRLNVAEATAETISVLWDAGTGYEAGPENTEFLYDLGAAGQIMDDLKDGDTELTDERLEELKEERLEMIEGHGLAGKTLYWTAKSHSSIWEGLSRVEDLLDSST
ncbi:MAG: hypothetical protein ABEJ75_01340 [Candidatus Nanohaloarchaea archaeon]